MFRLLLLLFLLVPLIEVYLFIRIGGWLGAAPTVLLCILTAVTGAILVRLQGLQTLSRVQQKLRLGETPAVEMIEGLILLLAGVLLMVPGFFTDLAGLLCLLPPLRTWLAETLLGHPAILRNTAGRRIVIIEGEFHEEQDRRLR